jgi:hypothetical protein
MCAGVDGTEACTSRKGHEMSIHDYVGLSWQQTAERLDADLAQAINEQTRLMQENESLREQNKRLLNVLDETRTDLAEIMIILDGRSN